MDPEEQETWKHDRMAELVEEYTSTCTGYPICAPVSQLCYRVADLELKLKQAETPK